MKSMIMSLATAAALLCTYTTYAQSGKGAGQVAPAELRTATGTNTLRENTQPNATGAPAVSATPVQDTTRPKRDTVRAPQPVPPVPPPVPTRPDTPGK